MCPAAKSSKEGELHPNLLTEPDLNLSIHPALQLWFYFTCYATTNLVIAEPPGLLPMYEQHGFLPPFSS